MVQMKMLIRSRKIALRLSVEKRVFCMWKWSYDRTKIIDKRLV